MQGTRSAQLLRRAFARVRAEVWLTALAIGRGLKGFYNSHDLTFASSIAYYALLSLFPFFLLAFSIIASVTSSSMSVKPRLDITAGPAESQAVAAARG